MSDLSLHIDCTYKWDEAKQFLASPSVRTAFLMNASAEQVQYALDNCDFVVVRVYDPFNERGALGEDFEKSIVNRRGGSDFVQWLDNSPFSQFKNDKRVRFVGGWNELYSKRGNAERTQNDNIVGIGQAIVDAGYGVGIGAWAADKSFYADDVNAGHWDSVIKFAVDNSDMVSIDCHEYDVLTIFNGHLKAYPAGFPDTLKSAIALDPNNHAKIPYSRSEGNIETNYKIGRIALLLQRSVDITGQEFKWYRGECALDFKDDGPLKPFIDSWYKPTFGQPTGINSLIDYYRHVLGSELSETAYDDLIVRQYTDLVSQDPASCQSNFIFAWNGDRNRWLPFDVAQRPYFVSLVANHNTGNSEPGEPEPVPSPIVFDPPLFPVTVKVKSGVWNLRSGMSTNTAILGQLTTEPVEILLSKVTNPAFGYNWYKYKIIHDTHEENGYFADTDKLVISDAGTEPNEPEIPDGSIEALVQDAVERHMAEMTKTVLIDVPFPNYTYTTTPLTIDIEKHIWRILHNISGVVLDRLENPTPTASQFADLGYKVGDAISHSYVPSKGIVTTVTPDVSDDGMVNEMLNGGEEESA